jgi:hypothetical protein
MTYAQGGAAKLDVEKTLTRTSTSPLEAPDDVLLEEGYIESVKRYHLAAEIERRWEWASFHECMEQLHTKLASEHREKAEALKRGGLVIDG